MAETETRIKAVAALTLLGTPAYVLCFVWHVCMAGHMQHAPYPFHQWFIDIWWIACFAAVLVFSFRLRAKRRVWFLCGSLALAMSRLRFGSFGGGGLLVELPLLVVMDVFAVKYLLVAKRCITADEHVEPANASGVN